MKASVLARYHQLPPILKNVVATIRGYQLERQRYGPATERLVAEALEREKWDEAEWGRWQAERLAGILSHAARNVPYYKAYWAAHPELDPARLEHWPILTKQTLRAQGAEFVSSQADRRQLFSNQTSGTTGSPLKIWQSRETARYWYALFEARWRRWNGVSRRDRWAILGGQLVVPFEQSEPPFWVRNRGLNQLYLSSYHLSPRWIPYYIEELERFRPAYLWGYSSALHTLAAESARLGAQLRFQVVLSNAEPLLAHQRAAVEQAFQSPVRETYGMCEMAIGAAQCAHGALHLWPETGVVEVINQDESGLGDLVSTCLFNNEMPLIRYRTGDRGRLSTGGRRCPCGRRMTILEQLDGRSDHVLITPDGRRIGRLDPVFKADLPIQEAQIIQETERRIRVNIVPSRRLNEGDYRSLRERLAERLGEMEITISEVDEIARGANGKYHAVINRMQGRQ